MVQTVRTYIGQSGVPLEVKQAHFLAQRIVRPTDMHAARRHLKIRQNNLDALWVNHRCRAGFHNFLDGFHARPNTGEAAHGKCMHTQIQNVLHAGREKHRRATRFKNMVALVRCRGTLSHMVVTCHRQYATPRRGASHIGVFEHIGTTVYTWAFAIPNAKDTIKFIAACWCKTQLLRAPQGSSGQLFIHTGLEHDVLRLQIFFGPPQGLVVSAQRRSPVTTDKACSVLTLQCVTLALQHRQFHQGLHTTHESTTNVQAVFVIQRDVF